MSKEQKKRKIRKEQLKKNKKKTLRISESY